MKTIISDSSGSISSIIKMTTAAMMIMAAT
jgi:hypothetical protein